MQLYKNNFDGFFIVSNEIKKTTESPEYILIDGEDGPEEIIGGYITEHLESCEEISVEEAEKLVGKKEVDKLLK
jgi:hypothetical protein